MHKHRKKTVQLQCKNIISSLVLRQLDLDNFQFTIENKFGIGWACFNDPTPILFVQIYKSLLFTSINS